MYQVKISGRALSEYEIALAWWQVHREKAPDLLKIEFQDAVSLLKEQPTSGLLASDNKEVRRILLRKSRYAIYYQCNEPKRQVVILAFWHSNREGSPL